MTTFDFLQLQEFFMRLDVQPSKRMLLAITVSNFRQLIVPTWQELSDKKPGFRFTYMGFKCILIEDDVACPVCSYLEGEHKMSCPNNTNKVPKIQVDL